MNTATKTRLQYSLNDVVTVNVSMLLGSYGASQSELGRAIGMNQASVNRRLQGLTEWRIGEIEDIAGVLGVTPMRLLTAPDEMDAIMARKLDKHPSDGSHRMGALARSKGFEPPTF